MQCPNCSFESPFERVCCPRCQTSFEADTLEELTHLRYLRGRLQRWRREALLSEDQARRAMEETGEEMVALEERLGLRMGPAAATAPIAVAEPPAVEAPPVTAPAAEVPPVAAPLPVASVASVEAESLAPPALPPIGPSTPEVEAPQPGRPGRSRSQAPTGPLTLDGGALAPAPRTPDRPAFSWSDLGTSLLSERTLHALLGLGAFLILASGVVISTLNPTNLGPLPHLAAVVATTVLFYAAGFVVRQKLQLAMTGAVLLAIGGAFVPLSIWTLGQEQLLRWDPTAVWLAASLICLPLYLVSHAFLRDRTFAILAALAGGSQLLAALVWLRVPLEWALCAALLLALGYLRLAKRLAAGWDLLAWALFWTAQVAAPLFMALLMVARFFPVVYEVSTGRALGGLYEYAVGVAWWLGVAFYGLARRLFERRRYAFAAAWVLPFAYLFTLTRAPWDADWYNLCLALLGAGYLAAGRWHQRLLADVPRPRLGAILAQPAYQVGLALTLVAALWPFQVPASRVPTLYAIAGVYALAAWLLRHVLFRYGAAYVLPLAVVASLERLDSLGLAWAAPAWWSVALALLAPAYLLFARLALRLETRGPGLRPYLRLAAEPACQAALVLTLAAALWPAQTLDSRIPTLYLVAATYALAARLFGGLLFRYAAAYLLPLPFAFSLEKLGLLEVPGFAPAWHGVALAALAAAYLLFERFWDRARWAAGQALSYCALAREPVLQVALLLTLVAALWPRQTRPSEIAALLVVSATYAAAAFLLRQRAWAYVAVYLLPLVCQLFQDERGLDRAMRSLAWAALAAVLLGVAESAVRRSGEARRPLLETAIGRGAWRSRFASPLFSAGYAAGLAALALGLAEYWGAPAAAGVRHLAPAAIFGLLGVTGLLVLSSLGRRTSGFLYPAVWLLLVPLSAGARRLAHGFDVTLLEHDQARLLAGLGLAYLLLAYRLDRRGEAFGSRRGLSGQPPGPNASPLHAWPLYLAGYVLSLATMLLSSLDRAVNVQVVGLSLLVYAASAGLVHRDRFPSYQALVARLFRDPASAGHRTARALFLYLACWLFPAWLLLAMSLWRPAPEVAHYGLALALLAPLYAAVGRWVRRVRAEYRWPWYLAGYALSAIGPLVATTDDDLRVVALAISIGLYAASAVVARAGAWLWPVALLLPVLLWQTLDSFWLFERYYGLGLVVLGIGYGKLGLLLHHGNLRRLLQPICASVGGYALPFFAVGYALSALGLARLANQERELVVIGFLVGALHYAGSALVFRQRVFSWPLTAAVAVAYVVGMTLTPLDPRFYGLGLLPGVAAYLTVAEVLRRRLPEADAAPLAVGKALEPEEAVSGGAGILPAEVALSGGAGFQPAGSRGLEARAPRESQEALRRRVDTPSRRPAVPPSRRLDAWSAPFYLAAYLGTLFVPAYSTQEQGVWALAWWSVAIVALVSTALFRHPGWLYPTVAPALAAWTATAYVFWPDARGADVLASLAGATWLLFWTAYAVARRGEQPAGSLSSHVFFEVPRGLWHRWAAPLLVSGWLVIGLTSLGTLLDAEAGLRAAGANALLLAIFALVWRGLAEVWGGLALGLLAFQQALRFFDVPLLDQPPRWALLALLLSLLAIGLKRRPVARLAPWPLPLEWTSMAVGVGAVLGALAFRLAWAGRWAEYARVGLQPLAATAVVTGLTLVAHGFDRRARLLGYLGVALVEAGYMLQLVFFEVGQPQAFVLPAGLYLLSVGYLEWRRGSGPAVKRPLEVAGLALLLVVSLLQAVGFLGAGHDRYTYATFLLLESSAIFWLGAVLHWRFTFFAGALALVADVAILLADPLRSMNTWYLVAVIGFVMITTVLFVERQRQRIPLWVDDWRRRLETWD